MRAWILIFFGAWLASACGGSPHGLSEDALPSVDGAAPADAEAAPDGATPADGGSAEASPPDGIAADGDGREAAAACPPALVSAAELASTPRADINLELLALKLSPGKIIADEATYQRVVRDVGAIRAQQPEVAKIGYFAQRHDGKTVGFYVLPATVEEIKVGNYHGWDCLNETYGAVPPAYFGFIGGSTDPVFGMIKLEGIYAMDLVVAEYARLPDIIKTETSVLVGGGPTICVTSGPSTWHYVFDDASGDCPAGCNVHTYRHFTTESDGAITVLEVASTGVGTTDPAPAWVTQFASRAACR